MPLFDYKAVTADGSIQQGRMDGASREAVIAKIQSLGQIPISADEVSAGSALKKTVRVSKGSRTKVKQTDILSFTQSLASLLNAGIALDRALEIMSSVEENPTVREIIADVQKQVREGKALSKALEQQEGVFSRFYINMVKTAEASGNMNECMTRLGDYLKNSKALHDKVISAMIYPFILTGVAGISLLIILTYVVPQFAPLFEDMGETLPTATKIILMVADWVQVYGIYGIAGLTIIAALVKMELSSEVNRRRFDRVVLKMPLAGDLVRKIEMARLSRSLGTLLKGGVPLLSGMSIAREVVGNSVMQQDLQLASERLKEGGLVSDSLLSSANFPRLAIQMMKVGEESGNMDGMLLEIADGYDVEVSTQVQRLLMVLEPILIIGLGVAIAGIIISVLIGIVSINDLPM
jgi:general secretion pathway protein F